MRHADEPEWVGDVLAFWFGDVGERQWFAKDDVLDARIRERFGALQARLLAQDGAGIAGTRATLAAVIVMDQFSRNLFRGDARAFAADPLARRLARGLVAAGEDSTLETAQRLFLYLPFEHHEDRDGQALSVRLISALSNESWTDFALAHQRIIDRFGRFPHRNAALGRESTPAELAALAAGMGF